MSSLVTSGLMNPFDGVIISNYLYISQTSTHCITRTDLTTGNTKIFSSGLNGPRGIANNSDYMYICSYVGNFISRIYIKDGIPDILNPITWITGLKGPHSIVLHENYAYVTNLNNNSITKTDINTGVTTTWVTGLEGPRGIAIDNNYAYVINNNNSSITKIDINTGVKTTWVTGLSGPYEIVLHENYAYVSNSTTNSITRTDINTGVTTTWATGIDGGAGGTGVRGIVLDTNYIYVINYINNNYITRTELTTGNTTIFNINGSQLNKPYDIAINNNYAYTTNFNNSSITKTDLNTGNTITWVTGLNGPHSIVLHENYAYVTNYNNGSITKTDINTGVTTTWVTGLFGPRGIAIDNNYAYVNNQLNASITKIDINTGVKTTWVTGLSGPYEIVLHENYAYVSNSNTNSITKTDINTGVTTTWATGFNSLTGISIYNNDIYISSSSSITKKNLTTGTTTILETRGIDGLKGLRIYNSYIYACSSVNNTIYRYFINYPTNLILNINNGSINLNWDNVVESTSYYILYGETTSYGNAILVLTNSATITNIILDKTYNFTVQAINGLTMSNISNNVTILLDLGCFLADSKVLTDSQLVPIQLLKKGDLVQTLNHGLLPVKFVGKCSFFNKLTEERINAHLYKLNKNDFPELLEDLYVTGGHPLLVDNVDEETKKKLLDMDGTPIITEGKYRVFACLHPKSELWNDEKEHEIFDIVLENEDPKKNYGIWVNGILTESMDEDFFLNNSGMTEINN